MEMQKLKNGIYATAMDMYINRQYEEFEFEDDTDADNFIEYWLENGVPDGNSLEDNINDFGDKEDINELLDTFLKLCKYYKVSPNYSKEIEEIKKNIVEMLDNPYYDMV
jgi:hypothetical protein